MKGADAKRRPSLLVWCGVGCALNASLAALLWLILERIGPLGFAIYVQMTGLALLPWFTNILFLSAIFEARGIQPLRWLASTLLFTGCCIILPVLLGFMILLIMSGLWSLIQAIQGGVRHPSTSPYNWIDRAEVDLMFMLTATIVGATLGLLAHALRSAADDTVYDSPCLGLLRADVLGGAVAAILGSAVRFSPCRSAC